MSDGNEWFKDVKRLIRGLEVETVEDPFACPTVKSVTDGEDVLHALGLHPSRDVCGIVNVDIDEVYGLIRQTGYEKALLVGLFDRTFTCLDHRISASDEDAGPTRRPVAVVMRRDGRLQEVDPWRVVIDDSEEVFEMYSWMWDEESVVCEQLGLAEVKAEKGGDE